MRRAKSDGRVEPSTDDIRPPVRFFVQLYRYREYLRQSATRNLRIRYKRSMLGYLWSLLHPLLMMVVLVAVFSRIVRLDVEDYAVFLLCAMLPWNFFNSTVVQSMGSVRRAVPIMRKLPVPKQIFVADVVVSNLVIYGLSLLPLFLVMLVLERQIPWTVFLLPLYALPLVCVTTGLALLCSIAVLFFEDVNHLVDVGLRALYFLTPILYGRQHLPEPVLAWVSLNPLFGVVDSLRQIVYAGELPPWSAYVMSLTVGVGLLALAILVFERVEKRVMYVV